MFSVLYQVQERLQTLLKDEGISVIAANSFVKVPDNVITDLKVSKVRGWIGSSVFKPSYISHDSPVTLKITVMFSQTSFLLLVYIIAASSQFLKAFTAGSLEKVWSWTVLARCRVLEKIFKGRFDFWKRGVNVKEQIQGGRKW